MNLWEECKGLQDYIVGIRRALHQIPELGTDLPKTQAAICAELDKLGISYKKNVGDSGLIGTIQGGKPGKTPCPSKRTRACPSPRSTRDACTPADTTTTRPCSSGPCAS